VERLADRGGRRRRVRRPAAPGRLQDPSRRGPRGAGGARARRGIGHEQARARHENARRERDRLERLAESGTLSQAELDRARTERDAAEAAERAALARVQAQEAAVRRAEVLLEKCEIHAPFDGIVAELYVEVGEWAVPGKEAMKILDPTGSTSGRSSTRSTWRISASGFRSA
jgi:multidrug efflux pump subunit AcrA (membrane-fusion protein)